ncbi:rhomboid domain-containing protein, partial [Haematococcus lacustris]
MVINALCYALQLLSQDSALSLTLWGAKVNSLIASGQLWRLITPAFLHSSLLHLVVNSYALNSFCPHVELVAGSQRFSVLYLTSAFTGTLASYALTSAPSLGAS